MNILSFVFVIFMIILMVLMTATKQERTRQIILLAASYVFYAYADYRFLGILLTQTMIAYCTARIIVQERKKGKSPKLVLIMGVMCCVGVLSIWKYAVYYIPILNHAGGGIIKLLCL